MNGWIPESDEDVARDIAIVEPKFRLMFQCKFCDLHHLEDIIIAESYFPYGVHVWEALHGSYSGQTVAVRPLST